jgi:hypothetical protein
MDRSGFLFGDMFPGLQPGLVWSGPLGLRHGAQERALDLDDMPRFLVRNTFELRKQPLFVLAGSVVEGEIQQGMFVRIPFNSSLTMTVRIHSMGFEHHAGGSEDICLGIECGPELVEIWRSLDLTNEVLEVVTEDLDSEKLIGAREVWDCKNG